MSDLILIMIAIFAILALYNIIISVYNYFVLIIKTNEYFNKYGKYPGKVLEANDEDGLRISRAKSKHTKHGRRSFIIILCAILMGCAIMVMDYLSN